MRTITIDLDLFDNDEDNAHKAYGCKHDIVPKLEQMYAESNTISELIDKILSRSDFTDNEKFAGLLWAI